MLFDRTLGIRVQPSQHHKVKSERRSGEHRQSAQQPVSSNAESFHLLLLTGTTAASPALALLQC
jgi:hypothetical protein